MKIDDALNLVFPINDGAAGVALHAYHAPISREVFEANYRLLAATKAALSSKGIHFQMGSGPLIAALTLRDEAKKDAAERGDVDAQGNASDILAGALLAEIRRLTTILVPTPEGWQALPVDAALARNFLDDEDWSEAESALVFFTCHFALARKAERSTVAQAMGSLFKGTNTSLSPTAFAASLPTLTQNATTAAKAASSVAS